MKITSKIFVTFSIILVVSCSTKKDSLISRNFHTLTTKYNVLFNGQESFKKGLEDINASYKDNYWELLPIEPLKVEEKIVAKVPDTSSTKATGPFALAEEKSVKAIQRHSMNIKGRERNRQIDDAYLLLGKARYYSSRFVPALEAFNYVIEHYPGANLIAETVVWQAKTQIRLRNEEQAILSLKRILKWEYIDKKNTEDAHTALAMAYLSTDSIQMVINHLNKSVRTDENKPQHARNLFILGQLYRTQQKIDSSNYAFNKVLNYKKSPYKYIIHSQIEKAKNTSNGTNNKELEHVFSKLVKDRDNRPFLDKLYYHSGNIAKKLGKESEAIAFYKKSIHAKSAENHQKSLSYQALGDINFDKSHFIVAGAYYDSILSIAPDKNIKRIRQIIRKRANLNDVITQEYIASTNDSILNVISLDKLGRITYFEDHIAQLKKADEALKKTKATYSTGFGKSLTGANKTALKKSNTWYFYNVQTIGFGAQEFTQIWGTRPLEDNWRVSNKTVLHTQITTLTSKSEEKTRDSLRYSVDFYLSQVPTEKKEIDSITLTRNKAYFNLGLIYKEQFKIAKVAIDRFEKLLTLPQNKNWRLPSNYHLYKLYAKIDSEKSELYKQHVLTEYEDSKYAQIILNPNKVVAEANSSDTPEKIYATTYYLYKDNKYQEVVTKATKYIHIYESKPIVPKFELLKAYSIGKLKGSTAFKEALEFIQINYPNTEEADKATQLINKLKK